MQPHTLIGEFPSEPIARDVVRELTKLFAQHAREVDEADGDTWMTSDACRSVASRYGFEWDEGEGLPFADAASGPFLADLPEVGRAGRQVAVFCGYGAGFGSLPKYFRARGAAPTARVALCVGVSFDLPRGERGDALAGALVRFFDQGRRFVDLEKAPLAPPWLGRKSWKPPIIVSNDDVAWSTCDRRFEFVIVATPSALPPMRSWLRGRGATAITIEYCDEGDVERVRVGIEVERERHIRWRDFESLLARAHRLTEGTKTMGYALELRETPAPKGSGLLHWDVIRSIDGTPLTPASLAKISARAVKRGTMVLRIDRGPDPWKRLAVCVRLIR